MTHRAYIAWSSLGIALLAWALVGLFAWSIAGSESDAATRIVSSRKSSTKEASAIRTHALALGTAKERAQLDTLLSVDVGSVVDMIESVGKTAGVTITLSNAVPEGAGNDASIRAIGFVVTAEGSFSALMRVAKMFETLPIPSTLKSLDIEHAPNASPAGAPSPWHMNAAIRVLTTANISS